MLFNNVMEILKKCHEDNLNDILVAEDMLKNGREDDKDFKEACDFLNKYYEVITKCNRLDRVDIIEDICNAKDNEAELKKLIDLVKGLAE